MKNNCLFTSSSEHLTLHLLICGHHVTQKAILCPSYKFSNPSWLSNFLFDNNALLSDFRWQGCKASMSNVSTVAQLCYIHKNHSQPSKFRNDKLHHHHKQQQTHGSTVTHFQASVPTMRTMHTTTIVTPRNFTVCRHVKFTKESTDLSSSSAWAIRFRFPSLLVIACKSALSAARI